MKYIYSIFVKLSISNMCRGAADKKTTHCGCDEAQRGARGAHLPYLVNDTGNPWVKKYDPYPYPSKPVPVVQGYRWFSSGVDDVLEVGGGGGSCILSDGGGGRQRGLSVRISSNGEGGSRQRDPSAHISSDGGGGGRQGPLCLHFERWRGL